jgi:hypothetical protein
MVGALFELLMPTVMAINFFVCRCICDLDKVDRSVLIVMPRKLVGMLFLRIIWACTGCSGCLSPLLLASDIRKEIGADLSLLHGL